MNQDQYNKATELERVLYDRTGMLAKNHPPIVEAMRIYAKKKWSEGCKKQREIIEGVLVDRKVPQEYISTKHIENAPEPDFK